MNYTLLSFTIPIMNRIVQVKSLEENHLVELTISQINKMKTLFETSSAYEYEFMGKKVKHSDITRLTALFDAMNTIGMTEPMEAGAICMAFMGWLVSDSCSRKLERKPYYIEPATVYIDKPMNNIELYKVYDSMMRSTMQSVWVELPSGKTALIEAEVIFSDDDIARDQGKAWYEFCDADDWFKAVNSFWDHWESLIYKDIKDEIKNAAELYGVSKEKLNFFPYK